ncbi:MAG: response regulator [Lachnospiraceae bacterium]|nr:response regulator [Lachnospiraceae bacterium]
MKRFKRAIWLIIAIQIVLLIYVALYFQVDDVTLVKGEVNDFNTGWTIYREDGTNADITLPYTGTSKAYETIVIENTAPKEFAGLSMRFVTSEKQFRVMLDGEEIYCFGTNDVRKFGHTPGSVTNYVDIPNNLGEGKIRIEMTSAYVNYASYIYAIEVGRRDVLILRHIAHTIPSMVCNMVILFAALILGATMLISVADKGKTGGVEYLHCVGFVSFIYFTIESRLLRPVYGNQTLYSFMLFFCLMLMPIFLLLYFEANVAEKYQKLLKGTLLLTLVNAVVQIVLQTLDLVDFINMAIVSYLLILITVICGIIIYADKIKSEGIAQCKKDKETILTIVAIGAFGLGFIADLVRAYIARGEEFAKYSRVGATVFSVFMVYIHIRRISKMFAANAEKAAERLQREKEKVEEQNKMLLQAREEAEAARQAAQDASRAKSSFLANVSHEIRTPINAILGMDTMILRESREDNIREYAGDIRSAGQNLLSLINDILDFSKIESGKMEIKPFDYELITLLGNCYNMIQMRAKEKGLFFRMENSTTIPHRLHGDEVRIRQIVINFLTNAVKYTEKGEVVLSVNWEKISDDRIKLILSVRDTGMGIKYEDQQSLFDSFQRFDLERNRNIEGTGLGLAITKQLVELMDGTIHVKSSYGRGSTFTVEIPQLVRSFNPIGEFEIHTQRNTAHEKEYQSDFTAPNARILVVDDVSMNLKVIRELLKSTKIQIDTVESGKECLRNITFQKYDIIFLDHMMPDMDGMETLKNMKWVADNKNSDTPVIMLTANAVVGAKDEYFNVGFDDYLAKPIKENELEQMIRKYLPKELVIVSKQAQTEETAPENRGSDEMISKDTAIHDKGEEQRKKEVSAPPEKQPADNRSIMEKLDFLDARAGLGYCAGSEGIYTEALKSYAVGKLRDEIEEYYEAEDWKKYGIKVHALKSTSLNIGAVELSEFAKALETASRNEDIAFIKAQHENIMKEYDEILVNLREALGLEIGE